MKDSIRVIGSLVLLGFSATALAQRVETIPVRDGRSAGALAAAADLPYTYVQGSFFHAENDDENAEEDGFAVEGSFSIIPMLFLVGSVGFSEVEVDGIQETADVTRASLGAGFRMDLTTNWDLNASARAVNVSADYGGASEDDTGYALAAGVRGLLIAQLEGRGELRYVDVGSGSGDSAVFGSLLYRIMPPLAAGLEFEAGEETTSYGVAVRWAF